MVTVYRGIFINVFNMLIGHEGPHVGLYIALIALELHAIVTAFLHDQVTGLSLAVQGIGRDGDATNIKHLNQLAQSHNLPAALGTLRHPKAQPRTMSKGGDNVQVRLGGCFIEAAPHLLAVDGNRWMIGMGRSKVAPELVEKRL